MYTNHVRCRACGFGAEVRAEGIKASPLREKLVPVFDLGVQPLSNDFASLSEEHAGFAPLKVLLCPRCSLAQLSVVVKPEILYSKYLYVTSRSETMYRHFDDMLETIREEQPFSSLLEIGSNDGTLLQYLSGQGVKVAGIDPSENLADDARKAGIPTVTGTFNVKTASRAMAVVQGGFDVIIARHVFCHVDNWKEFIDCLAVPCQKDPLICIEVPYVQDLLGRGEFDTIYHEHLSYLSIKAMRHLLDGSPFRLQRIVKFPIHGGAILLMLRRRDWNGKPDSSVEKFEEEEHITKESWDKFSEKAYNNINALKDFVSCSKSEGKRVVGFGASAKSTVWVNVCKFDRSHMEFITDTTPQKWYKLSPGTDIPIVDEGAILRELPDFAICFAWNFRDFVLKNNELARKKGVKFVFPIPSLEVV